MPADLDVANESSPCYLEFLSEAIASEMGDRSLHVQVTSRVNRPHAYDPRRSSRIDNV